ncbi:MAG TPA: tRNA (adenosine(37)-N6)-threonylcarbamoyltransferase complex dimerization subunit type 1 TsaB [Allosphingosinicella sp.]|jgi:tRNA threonylcarbamoyl adenosine modification protein YeaZ|uniref:tRNA (adenosine(37)-N6)-threonylcarbamoyltransferase complex dimerization subunit type 1 TsaB n=1 Tax=Allosphingosinicella sp. TaxID=2823234 RepID=UPI002F273669
MQLVIDCATAACSAALIEGARLVDERYELVGRGHAERLVPMIRELLAGRRPSSILVDCGPGSFTGVRVGLAAAHGLAIGWRKPLHGYSSLAAIAAAAGGSGELAVALQAGHGQLFVQSYDRDPLKPLDELRSLLPADAAAAIGARLVLGSGAETLVSARGHGEALDRLPRAADVRLLPEPLRTLPPRPIYGRAPDAKPQA